VAAVAAMSLRLIESMPCMGIGGEVSQLLPRSLAGGDRGSSHTLCWGGPMVRVSETAVRGGKVDGRRVSRIRPSRTYVIASGNIGKALTK